MAGQYIPISTPDGTFSAYRALPASGKGPGVLVLQEIFGVNAGMRKICNGLAEAGFVALCPDLFWRIEPGIELDDGVEADLERAFQLFSAFDVETGMQDIAVAIAHLRADDACTGRVGAMGYCLGGLLAFLTACRTDSDATVGYYGVGIEDRLKEADGLDRPLLLHIAGKDQFVPPAAQAKIHSSFDGHPMIRLEDYPEADHAFARPDGSHYSRASAEKANGLSLQFLREALA
ncbi:dienelactone hydrolase family protein [Maricaulis sp.]|uniref:dienelactone hydrolase family protein n=1 Tax=Maricaulis sp. TaxID=1486257 RepID=UPI0025BC3CB8|nr:dienelactone hydrolase family protein [Maricaulis sp.]